MSVETWQASYMVFSRSINCLRYDGRLVDGSFGKIQTLMAAWFVKITWEEAKVSGEQ
jgi:hypothetical protein